MQTYQRGTMACPEKFICKSRIRRASVTLSDRRATRAFCQYLIKSLNRIDPIINVMRSGQCKFHNYNEFDV